jgi:hypothetical protein
MLSLLVLLVSGCSLGGPGVKVPTQDCSGIQALRFRAEVIAVMNDAEVNDLLVQNEQAAAKGCAKPNQ